jgi:hypothetical protein
MKWCENETPIYKSSISKSDVIGYKGNHHGLYLKNKTNTILCFELRHQRKDDIHTILKNEKWSQTKPHIDKPIRKEWVQRFHKSELGKLIQKGMSPVNWAIQCKSTRKIKPKGWVQWTKHKHQNPLGSSITKTDPKSKKEGMSPKT